MCPSSVCPSIRLVSVRVWAHILRAGLLDRVGDRAALLHGLEAERSRELRLLEIVGLVLERVQPDLRTIS